MLRALLAGAGAALALALALALAFNTTGAAAPPEPAVTIASEVCTPFFPDPALNGGTCTEPVSGIITASGWKKSPSQARRTAIGVVPTGENCLPSTARWRLQYVRSDNSIINYAYSAWGWCGGYTASINSTVNGNYVYAFARCQIQSGYSVSRVGWCWTTWF